MQHPNFVAIALLKEFEDCNCQKREGLSLDVLSFHQPEWMVLKYPAGYCDLRPMLPLTERIIAEPAA